jgi:hypothetical protein
MGNSEKRVKWEIFFLGGGGQSKPSLKHDLYIHFPKHDSSPQTRLSATNSSLSLQKPRLYISYLVELRISTFSKFSVVVAYLDWMK